MDMELMAPNGQILYKDVKKQYDSFTWTTDQKGVYKFCFSNEFSTFSHKTVYFDFQVGDDDPLTDLDNSNAHHTAMTMVCLLAVHVYNYNFSMQMLYLGQCLIWLNLLYRICNGI